MHFPVLPLGAGGLGGLRGELGIRMDLAQWKVSKDIPEILPEVLLQGLDDDMGTQTVGALEVAVFHQREWRLLIALNVILGTDRSDEFEFCFHDPKLSSDYSMEKRFFWGFSGRISANAGGVPSEGQAFGRGHC